MPADWAARSVLPGAAAGVGEVQQHLWWSLADDEGDFHAYGHNGQYLYVNPRARTVIVKFSETKHQDPVPLLRAMARALKRPENIAELDPLGGQAYAFHLPTERRTP